jgi:hypothetical protein
MISWTFVFVDNPEARVLDGELGFNAAAPYPGNVTRVFVDNLNADGLNVRRAILAHPIGTMIWIQNRIDAGIYAALVMTGRPIEQKAHLEIPVTCSEASPDALSGTVETFFLPVAPVLAVRAIVAASDPVLVTLETAKSHLRITDTDHDADVTQKMGTASATIRDYLKDRNDATWTPDTVPPWIQAAVLILLAHQYEHRGDEFGSSNDNDDRAWAAIDNLLRRSRDPALA